MCLFLRYIATLILILNLSNLFAQDIIIKTNGAHVSAKVVRISDDSVFYKNKSVSGNLLFSVARNEVKLIEYWNGKKDYLQGSYVNMSEQDSTTVITGIKSKEQNVVIAGIHFHIERLFTEYHLMLDYTYHPDTNFIASKGKIEFDFENSKNNFFVKYFPTGDKTSFAKFLFNETEENKRYDRLSNNLLVGMNLYYEDSVSHLVFDEEESMEIKEMFSGKDIKYEP